MFDSNNNPPIDLDKTTEEQREARREALREDVDLYMKSTLIKSPWRRALISFVFDALIFFGRLAEAFPQKR